MRFRDYVRLNESGPFHLEDHDEIEKHFVKSFLHHPKLMSTSSDISDLVSRYLANNPNVDPDLVRNIATKAKDAAREIYSTQVAQDREADPQSTDFEVDAPEDQKSAALVANPTQMAKPDEAIPFADEQPIPAAEDPDYYDRMFGGSDLNKRQVARVKKLAKNGWNAARIAARTGMPEDSIEQVMGRGNEARTLTKNQREQIVNLSRQGQTAADIAFHTDVPIWVVQQQMQKLGVGEPDTSAFQSQQAAFPEPGTPGEWDYDVPEKMAQRAQWDKPEIPPAEEDLADRKAWQKDKLKADKQYTKDTAWPPDKLPDAPEGPDTWQQMIDRPDVWKGNVGKRKMDLSPEQIQQIQQAKTRGDSDQAIAFDMQLPKRIVMGVQAPQIPQEQPATPTPTPTAAEPKWKQFWNKHQGKIKRAGELGASAARGAGRLGRGAGRLAMKLGKDLGKQSMDLGKRGKEIMTQTWDRNPFDWGGLS